jgi:hypothetical protein
VRRSNELGIAHRYEEFPDNHTGVDYRMDKSLTFSRAGAVRLMGLAQLAEPTSRA